MLLPIVCHEINLYLRPVEQRHLYQIYIEELCQVLTAGLDFTHLDLFTFISLRRGHTEWVRISFVKKIMYPPLKFICRSDGQPGLEAQDSKSIPVSTLFYADSGYPQDPFAQVAWPRLDYVIKKAEVEKGVAHSTWLLITALILQNCRKSGPLLRQNAMHLTGRGSLLSGFLRVGEMTAPTYNASVQSCPRTNTVAIASDTRNHYNTLRFRDSSWQVILDQVVHVTVVVLCILWTFIKDILLYGGKTIRCWPRGLGPKIPLSERETPSLNPIPYCGRGEGLSTSISATLPMVWTLEGCHSGKSLTVGIPASSRGNMCTCTMAAIQIKSTAG